LSEIISQFYSKRVEKFEEEPEVNLEESFRKLLCHKTSKFEEFILNFLRNYSLETSDYLEEILVGKKKLQISNLN